MSKQQFLNILTYQIQYIAAVHRIQKRILKNIHLKNTKLLSNIYGGYTFFSSKMQHNNSHNIN